MASIETIIGQLQTSAQKVNESVQVLVAADNSAAQLQAQLAGSGIRDKAAALAQVRDSIRKTQQYLAGGREMLNQLMNQAKQAGG